MSVLKAAIWCSLVCLPGAVLRADARQLPYSEVFGRDTGSIAGITTCGRWSDRQVSGRYRVLSMEGQSLLYVDKVTISADQARFDVVKGIAITEIDNDHVDIVLSKLRCMPTKDGVTIRATAWGANIPASRGIRIDLRESDDRYRISGL